MPETKTFVKVATKDVTETLARAMEHADSMSQVIVIYETHEDNKHSSGGIFCMDDVTLSKINWLLDMGKHWLWDLFAKEGGE